MDSAMIKIYTIQFATLIAVFIINAILAFSFYQLVLLGNIQNILNFQFKLSDFFFLFFTIYILILNTKIPFRSYNNEDDIDDQITNELTIITGHIFLSALIVGSLIIAMYCFNTY